MDENELQMLLDEMEMVLSTLEAQVEAMQESVLVAINRLEKINKSMEGIR